MIYRFLLLHLRWLLVALAVLVAMVSIYSFLTARPKAEAKLGKNQTEAAVKSGEDAVNTVGKAGERENELDGKVNDANAKVDSAPDAASADTAGRDGLCGISSDFCGK